MRYQERSTKIITFIRYFGTFCIGTTSNLLAARPITEHRRSSHTGIGGVPTQRRTSQSLHNRGGHRNGSRKSSDGSHSGRVRDGAFASGSTSPRYGVIDTGNVLLLPTRGRSRGASLPGNMNDVQQEDIYRLRNFATSGKKVINRGDSVRSKSRVSLTSAASR